MRQIRRAVPLLIFIALGPLAGADTGDPQVKTDHPW